MVHCNVLITFLFVTVYHSCADTDLVVLESGWLVCGPAGFIRSIRFYRTLRTGVGSPQEVRLPVCVNIYEVLTSVLYLP